LADWVDKPPAGFFVAAPVSSKGYSVLGGMCGVPDTFWTIREDSNTFSRTQSIGLARTRASRRCDASQGYRYCSNLFSLVHIACAMLFDFGAV